MPHTLFRSVHCNFHKSAWSSQHWCWLINRRRRRILEKDNSCVSPSLGCLKQTTWDVVYTNTWCQFLYSAVFCPLNSSNHFTLYALPYLFHVTPSSLPCALGAATADYISTSSSLPLSNICLLMTAPMKWGRPLVLLGNSGHILPPCYMQYLGQEWVIILGFPQLCIYLQIGAGIRALPTADAVATGEVSCCNCTVRLSPLSSSTEMIGQR